MLCKRCKRVSERSTASNQVNGWRGIVTAHTAEVRFPVSLVGHVCHINPPRLCFHLRLIPMLGRQHSTVVLVLLVTVSDEELVRVQMYQDVMSRREG